MKANSKIILLACVLAIASVVVVCKASGQTQESQDATIVNVTKRTITRPPQELPMTQIAHRCNLTISVPTYQYR